MTVELPERLGRYRVEAVIGSGGFATVYRAHDERLDARVAIKVLAENHCLDPDVRERFLTEGRVLRRIGSPHVVTVHDLGETSRGQPFLVLDHADRGDLAARVHERRAAGWTPGPADAVAVVEATADALAAVHASGLVHRDVAPRNLLLRSVRAAAPDPAVGLIGRDEQLVLADLGLSKDLAAASGLTVGGGTAGFTPPEQRSGLTRVDHRADIWAASALVVWLLAGVPPDDEGHWQERLAAGGWPAALGAALARGLAGDPPARYDDVSAWAAAVRDAISPTVPLDGTDDAGDPPPAAPVTTTVAPAPRRPARPVLALLAVLVAGALIGLAAVWLYEAGTGDAAVTVEPLAGGRTRTRASAGDRSVSVVGPATVTAGETATFTAESQGSPRVVWIAPDGAVKVDAAELRVRTRTPGRATVTLIGVDGEGNQLTASHTVVVVAPTTTSRER